LLLQYFQAQLFVELLLKVIIKQKREFYTSYTI